MKNNEIIKAINNAENEMNEKKVEVKEMKVK